MPTSPATAAGLSESSRTAPTGHAGKPTTKSEMEGRKEARHSQHAIAVALQAAHKRGPSKEAQVRWHRHKGTVLKAAAAWEGT